MRNNQRWPTEMSTTSNVISILIVFSLKIDNKIINWRKKIPSLYVPTVLTQRGFPYNIAHRNQQHYNDGKLFKIHIFYSLRCFFFIHLSLSNKGLYLNELLSRCCF